ncbi:MAG: hypothetical protein SFV81_08005 [Pirellulaceae bacterium]|nr:hypothetical protein [Pirellulaceae bacterium]
MSEPPILPAPDEPTSENPFAPSYAGTFAGGAPRVHLDAAYWIAFSVLLLGCVAMLLSSVPMSWVATFVCIAGAIRVPLLQRKHYREVAGVIQAGLPTPVALFFSSLALSFAFVLVSFIAFMAVCIPGTIAFGFGDLDQTVFWVSGLLGLLCFCGIFFLSLRLRF